MRLPEGAPETLDQHPQTGAIFYRIANRKWGQVDCTQDCYRGSMSEIRCRHEATGKQIIEIRVKHLFSEKEGRSFGSFWSGCEERSVELCQPQIDQGHRGGIDVAHNPVPIKGKVADSVSKANDARASDHNQQPAAPAQPVL